MAQKVNNKKKFKSAIKLTKDEIKEILLTKINDEKNKIIESE